MAVSATTAANLGWISGGISLFVLLLRLSTHHYLVGKIDASTYVVIVSLFVLAARIACNHYVLTYGTISGLVSDAEDEQPYTQAEFSVAHMGTTLTLVTRLLVTTFYWLQCAILLLVYHRLVSHITWVRHAIRFCWAVIGITYIAVAFTTFLECHPFWLYYSTELPECSKAYAQLWVQCLSNIVIDIVLMAISLPIMREQIRLFPKNLQLGTIFVLGFFCIVISCLRIRYIYADSSAQPTRSMWASIQALVATFVANAPSIYGALKLWRRKGRSGSTASSSSPIMRGAIGMHHTAPTWTTKVEPAHLEPGNRDSFHSFLPQKPQEGIKVAGHTLLWSNDRVEPNMLIVYMSQAYRYTVPGERPRSHINMENPQTSKRRLQTQYPNAEIYIWDVSDAHACYAVLPPFHLHETECGYNIINAALANVQSGGPFKHMLFSSVLHPILRALTNHESKRMVEEYLVESRLVYTIVQPTHMMETVSISSLMSQNEPVMPRFWNPETRFSFVTARDIGEAAARILEAREKHFYATYQLVSTPEATSYVDVAGTISEEIGKEVQLEQKMLEEGIEVMIAGITGRKAEDASWISRQGLGRMLLHYNDRGTVGNPNVLKMLLGRKPTGYRERVRFEVEEAGR